MTLVDVHTRLANTALFFTIIMALWGIWRYFRRQGVDGSYWGALVIAEILYLVQAVIGVSLWLSGNRPGQIIHLLYGVVSILVVPGVFVYTKGDEQRRAMLIYGISFLFMIGIILRALMTGRLPG